MLVVGPVHRLTGKVLGKQLVQAALLLRTDATHLGHVPVEEQLLRGVGPVAEATRQHLLVEVRVDEGCHRLVERRLLDGALRRECA